MVRFCVLLSVCAFAFFPSFVSAQDKLVVFGGYSYLRPPVTAEEITTCTSSPTCPDFELPPKFVTNRQSLNGWELSGTYRLLPFLGITADFAGHYGAPLGGTSSSVHQYSYLFGPELSLPSRVSPFVHLLVGGAHQSISAGSLNNGTNYNGIASTSANGFATAIGAGIDLKVIPHVWIRPIQIDYELTRFNSASQSSPRVSAGLVLHF